MSSNNTVRIVGGLFPAQLVERIASGDSAVPGTAPADYHQDSATELNQSINRAWAALSGRWATYKAARALLPEGDRATVLTRERWLLPLFQELGFGRLQPERSALEADGRPFAISHRWGRVPIHLVGAGLSLDKRIPGERGAAASAPHALVQDFLNHDPAHLWAFVSNGLELRILRDHRSLTQQAYVTFDLETLFDGDQFSAFRLLYLLCHVSRVEADDPHKCRLEQWVNLAREDGIRALDRLRTGVEAALAKLGSGFVAHRANGALRSRLTSGALSTQDLYRQLLRLVYRLLFLFVAEDRDLLLVPDAPDGAKDRYRRLYATRRLRNLALRRRGSPHDDAWHALRLVMRHLDRGCFELALPALGSFLWGSDLRDGQRVSRALPDLDEALLDNEHLHAALGALCAVQDGAVRRPVDWAGVQSDELGSVYEALMEKVPRVNAVAGTFELADAAGNERKTTGSYYTPSSLVDCLLDSALDPVLEEAARKPDPERAILELAVVDPACGSGHFLVAAARRIARRLARVRCGGIEPSPPEVQHALRDVVGRCIYGVDLNPMAVELCKVSLWMEAMEPGRPLSFLDAHIQHGNALLGTTPELMAKGVPDAAWEPIEGDDKKAASALKKRNKKHAVEEQLAWSWVASSSGQETGAVAKAIAELEAEPDANPEGVARKESRWESLLRSTEYRREKFVADTWCAAFVWPKQPGALTEAAPTNEVWRQLRSGSATAPAVTTKIVGELATQFHFFHWHLQFPRVFAKGGFDVVLGNPPWDSVRFSEDEFFAGPRPDIVKATTAAERKRLIAKLETEDVGLFSAYRAGLREINGINAFVRSGVSYPLCGVGRVNLFALFAEAARSLVGRGGRVGQILPSGIVSDDSTKLFFQEVIEKRQLVSFFDFENREGLFPAVHRSFKFGIFTLAGERPRNTEAEFVFFATRVEHITDNERRFTLSSADIALLNPSTRTCPIFRTRRDAKVTAGVYHRVPVLAASEWSVDQRRLINQSDDSGSFLAEPGDERLPLYEGKYFHHYDHRWVTNDGAEDRPLTTSEKTDPHFSIYPRHWYPAAMAVSRFGMTWRHLWVLAWRDITNATNERTLLASIVPSLAVPNTARVMFVPDERLRSLPALIANLSSFVLDFISRQKIGGMHMSGFIVEQLPMLAPSVYELDTAWSPGTVLRDWVRSRVLELTHTTWDIEPFARDVGYEGTPFRWDPERRFQLRCELDAAFFHLYGIVRDDVEYIMETFPIVRRNDEKAHGEYRTKRVILELYDAMAEAVKTGRSHRTTLEPLPASPGASHGVFTAQGTPANYAEALRMGLLFTLIRRSGEAGISQGSLTRALLWLEDARHAATGLQGTTLANFERVRESDPLLAQGSSSAPKLLQALENERVITRDAKGIVRLRAGSTIPSWLPQTPTLAELAGVMRAGLEQAETGASTTPAVETVKTEKAKRA